MVGTKRVKAQAAAWPVPQSHEEASAFIARIGKAQRERDRIETRLNDKLASVKAGFEVAAAPFKDEIERSSKGLQTWCEAHRDELTKGGRKYYRFADGEVLWRLRPPKVSIRGVKRVIARLKDLGLNRLIRVKEEVNKEAMLAERRVAEQIKGVSIEQGEDFVIKPFETELEEVA